MAVNLYVDGVGYPWYSCGSRFVDAFADIGQRNACAVATSDDNGGSADVAGGRVVVHIVRLADASLHPFVRDGGFYCIERTHLAIVDLDVFLAGGHQYAKND